MAKCKVYGVLPTEDLQKMILDVSRGKKKRDESIPKMTFSSHRVLADYASEIASKEKLRAEPIKA